MMAEDARPAAQCARGCAPFFVCAQREYFFEILLHAHAIRCILMNGGEKMKLLKWLSVTDRFAKCCLDAQLAPLGINSSQHMYLLKVCDEPGISQDSFLNSVYVHPSNIVRTIAQLERNGFLTRQPSAKDKRTWQLYPTQKALDIAGQVREACRATEELLNAELSPEEQTEFSRMLAGMGRRMAKELNVERVGDEFDE